MKTFQTKLSIKLNNGEYLDISANIVPVISGTVQSPACKFNSSENWIILFEVWTWQALFLLKQKHPVTWPWKYIPPNLPVNRELAMGRFRSAVARMRSYPNLMKYYDAIFQDQLDKEIIEKVFVCLFVCLVLNDALTLVGHLASNGIKLIMM